MLHPECKDYRKVIRKRRIDRFTTAFMFGGFAAFVFTFTFALITIFDHAMHKTVASRPSATTAIGYSALTGLTTGSNNTVIGQPTVHGPAREPTCYDRPSAAEQWSCFYDDEVRDMEAATRFGFAAPWPVTNEGSDVVMIDAPPHLDWQHPVGFAVVDCDKKVTMLDGKSAPLAVTISWDAKRSCLHVTPH